MNKEQTEQLREAVAELGAREYRHGLLTGGKPAIHDGVVKRAHAEVVEQRRIIAELLDSLAPGSPFNQYDVFVLRSAGIADDVINDLYETINSNLSSAGIDDWDLTHTTNV